MTMTHMEIEARETPAVMDAQLQQNDARWLPVIQRLQASPAPFAVTIARGSSDHAATFLKYVLEVTFGLPTVSAAPSVLTVYARPLQLNGALVVGISQSGKSPDLVEMMKAARDSGAITVALVNQENSPLADVSEYVVPIGAGVETAVAATKSYLGSLFACLHFAGLWAREIGQGSDLLDALQGLPDRMRATLAMDWNPLSAALFDAFEASQNGVVLARGFGFPIAQESALKLKETCAVHAEAFSSAEFLHGPMGMVRSAFPVLLYLQADATLNGSVETAKKIHAAGGKVCVIAPKGLLGQDVPWASQVCELPESLHPLLDPLLGVAGFYLMVAALAVRRGRNPDAPALLKKVTETR